VKTNDLKKGTRVKLRNGWFGTVFDNGRGNTRMVTVEGFETETGSVYAHDIMEYQDAQGYWFAVEHTESQLKFQKQMAAMGW
jgi:hypothetical protein